MYDTVTRASVQYDDVLGTVAADFSDDGLLYDVADLYPDEWSIMGFSLYGGNEAGNQRIYGSDYAARKGSLQDGNADTVLPWAGLLQQRLVASPDARASPP